LNARYCLNSYSISDLLGLIMAGRGDSVRLEVGQPAILMVKGQKFEVEGPFVAAEIVDELLRTTVSTRRVRDFRKHGVVEAIYTFKGARFLVRAVQAFGDFRLDLHALGSLNR
jgi:hypothetical protein